MLQRTPRASRTSFANIAWLVDGWRVRSLFGIRSFAWPLRQRSFRKTTFSFRPDFVSIFAALRAIEWQFWVVLAASAAVMMVMRTNMPFWYGGSDHSDYYWYGRYLLGDDFRGFPIPANWRTPGMGIFHILTGTVLFDTWKGLIAVFAAFSVAIPILFYLMVRPHSRYFALLAGFAIIASMTPYIFANQPLSDHVYFFLHALLLLLCVRYFQYRLQRTPALLFSIVGVAAYTSLVRPVGGIIFWIFILLALVLRWRDRRRLLAAAGVYVLLMTCWILWDRNYGTNGGEGPAINYPLANNLATSADRRFAEAYFSQDGLVHAESDAAAKGYPNSEKLREILRQFLVERPSEWQTSSLFVPRSLFANYRGHEHAIDDLLQAMFLDRNTLYFGFIVRVAKEMLGMERGSSLIYGVANEHGTTGLYGFVRNLVIHPGELLLGVTPNLGARTVFNPLFRTKFREQVIRVYTIDNLPNPALVANLGPASELLLKTLRRFIDDYPQFCPKPILQLCRNDPEAAYQFVARDDMGFIAEGLEPEGFLYQAVNWYLGPSMTGRLYERVDLEILHRYPKMLMLAYENLLNMTVVRRIGDATAPFDRNALNNMPMAGETYFEERKQIADDLPSGLVKELVPVIKSNDVWKDACALQMIVYLIAPVFLFLLIAALPLLNNPATLGPCVFLLVEYTSQVTSMAVFSGWGAMRYEANFYLLPFVIACMIFGQASSDLWRRRTKQRTAGNQPSAPLAVT